MEFKNILFGELSEAVNEAIVSLKDDFLITDRHIKGDFLTSFKDSLFEYRDGFLLIERFYKISKCKEELRSFSYMNEEDRKIIEEFNQLAQKALNSDKTEEMEQKINQYEEKIKQIKNQYALMPIYSYNNKTLLIRLKDIPDKTIQAMSDLYTSFILSFFSALTWNNLDDIAFTLATVTRNDYIDLIVFPSKIEKEDAN